MDIKTLEISVRKLTKEDIKSRELTDNLSGLVVTNIEETSLLFNKIPITSIIVEANKKNKPYK